MYSKPIDVDAEYSMDVQKELRKEINELSEIKGAITTERLEKIKALAGKAGQPMLVDFIDALLKPST